MRLLFTVLYVAIPAFVHAQNLPLTRVSAKKVDGMFVNWTKGQMSFDSGETIDCDIRFDQLNQNMDVRHQGVDLEIPYADIQSFNFYDSAKRQQRFFEKIVVASGKVVLMEYVFKAKNASIMEERFIRKFHMAYPDPVTLEKRKFRITMPIEKKFFYVSSTKQALLMTYQNLLLIAGNKAGDVKAFVQAQRLRMEKDEDFILALEFCDQL